MIRSRPVRSQWLPFVWRGVAFLLVFLAAFVGFLLGVGVTRLEITGLGWGEKAYYSLGLFVLGGLDIGTPVGGPSLGRTLLWTAYFLAPILTASALLEAVVRLMSPLAFRVRPLRGHAVIAGAGRLTSLYIRRLRERHPRMTVVVVELDPGHPRIGLLRELYRTVVVTGDITSDEVLRSVRVSHAHRVFLPTGDDFANLDAAAKILRVAPDLSGRIVAHVANLGFMRETAGSSVARDCVIFNGHEFAARHLVREHLLSRFRSTAGRDLVILAGFGRFGQTVLDQLQKAALDSFCHVVILDHSASRNARTFEEEPGFADGYDRDIIDGDLLDPAIWNRLHEVIEESGHDPVILVGSGDDGVNLQAALAVRKRHPEAYVICRSSSDSPFASEIAREANIRAFNLAGLIEEGMPADWF